jgi:hypothetical protein
MIEKFSLCENPPSLKGTDGGHCGGKILRRHKALRRATRLSRRFDGALGLPPSALSLPAAKFRFPAADDRAEDGDVGRSWQAAAQTGDVPNQL